MSRWWRAHDDSLDDPKIQRLPGEMFKAWYNLCCVSSKNDGQPFDIDEVTFRLRVSPGRARQIVDYLTKKNLIDVTDDRYLSHNWAARQFKTDVTDPTNAERQKRFRDRHSVTEKTVTPTVTVTPPRAETEQNRKEDAADAAPDPETELFARGKEVLGKDAGGLIAKLLKAKNKNVVLARAVIDTASQKQDPREYVSAVIRGPKNGEFKLMSGREGVI